MNNSAIAFLAITVALLLLLPRRWAPFPLLMGACYMTFAQVIEIGPLHFTVIRILVFVGFVRVLLRRERPAGGFCSMDWLMIVWGAWALCSSAFHQAPQAALITRLGLAYNALGIYLLIRCFCQNRADVERLIKMTAILLVPVSLEMLIEQISHRNLFSVFGGVLDVPAVRNERFRSQGPFAHAILAGTVGAVCVPLMIGIWRKHRCVAMIGIMACLLMIVTSASSGPLMSLIFGSFALILWRWRHLTRQMRIAAVLGYVFLDLVMKAPAYFLIARIDLTGGSTGWHRARLIQSSIEHISEWWWAGTDYTRHWMPTGVSWSPDHTDITNHYLLIGVIGGLPLMLLFIMIVWRGFRSVGETLLLSALVPVNDRFLIWAAGASLFAHTVTFIAVSYFDQSFLFLYLTLAIITSLRAAALAESEVEGSRIISTAKASEDTLSTEYQKYAVQNG